MAHLLVTRPKAGTTIKALKARGHHVTHAPLTELRPLAHSDTMHLIKDAETDMAINGVIVTSSNALTYAAPQLISHLKGEPVFCVGQKTAQTARDLGLVAQTEAILCCDTAEKLAGALLANAAQFQNNKFAYLCSKHRMSTLDDMMPSGSLHIIETYEAPFIKPHLEQSTPVDGVLLYSARAAQSWVKSGIEAKLHFCMSQNIAQYLSTEHQQTAIIATKPTERYLFAAIDKIFSPN